MSKTNGINFADKPPLPELPTCPACHSRSELVIVRKKELWSMRCCNCLNITLTRDSIEALLYSWIGNRTEEYNINDYKQYWEVKDETN